jgi:N-glycosylase/DNA lyase
VIEILAPEFDLAKTLDSGQVFHWENIGNGFVGVIGDLPFYAEQNANALKAYTNAAQLDCLKQPSSSAARDAPWEIARTVAHYFALDHRLAEICASFPDDPAMNAARQFCRGLRIIRQPKWECLATFICSSMKQVAHIRQISRKLRERLGEPRKVGNCTVYVFPSPERIAASSEKELRECALGYRAKNLLATARLVASGEADLEAWAALGDFDLQIRLCGLPGAGAKVANCVMLFAYERLRAFPIDVWIERVLKKNYFPPARKLTAAQLRTFTQEYFGEHGGYAQQYLFHHARTNHGRVRPLDRPDVVSRHPATGMTKAHG